MDFAGSKNQQEMILLSGASGMLGKAIAQVLQQRGAQTIQLVRREPRAAEVQWNPSKGELNPAALEGITAAIHLSGANVATRRWSEAYKKEMTESRVSTTRVLSEALAKLKTPPRVLIMASAVGFYGDRGEVVLDESSAPGRGFFPQLCQQWEAASSPAEAVGIRVVHLRFGMVLGPDGGALARLAPMFRLGLGGNLGSGKQWMSWVSEADAVGAVLFALNAATLSGSVNTVAPTPVTNATFTRELGQAVHRPTFFAAPAFALRLAFGEMADEALLASTRAVPKRLLEAGFKFEYPTLSSALAAALKK